MSDGKVAIIVVMGMFACFWMGFFMSAVGSKADTAPVTNTPAQTVVIDDTKAIETVIEKSGRVDYIIMEIRFKDKQKK